ncbi:MAG: acylphosphatase [Candidatus Heimdallarchaeota archaeon]|nr:acylphosphatase [Candidatus Heimdallarchaeota archaeon]
MNNKNENQHVQITAKGLVQGVSFRAYTNRKAKSLGLTGYVKNLLNGDVEIKAEGSREQITELINWLKTEGSPSSEVIEVIVEWSNKLENYFGFRIIF